MWSNPRIPFPLASADVPSRRPIVAEIATDIEHQSFERQAPPGRPAATLTLLVRIAGVAALAVSSEGSPQEGV
ncbi:hypothetical protein G5B40_18480 [Pikeienuella piscinae]|uniref:Uncharacterized protein n=1 Tax=Pikeienuella piscinae TaxID=2748098 RepID=A0A7M3T5H2_9RHOB|nr:hypothetical protein [Pikeienuella piscinae]QIE57253.1 hypothetical protein G5B40_18480 [Pikeienuella piscinae]